VLENDVRVNVHCSVSVVFLSIRITGESFWWRGRRAQRTQVQQQNDSTDNGKIDDILSPRCYNAQLLCLQTRNVH